MLTPSSHNLGLPSCRTVRNICCLSHPGDSNLLEQPRLAETEARLMQVFCLPFWMACLSHNIRMCFYHFLFIYITHSCLCVVYERGRMTRRKRIGLHILQAWFKSWPCPLLAIWSITPKGNTSNSAKMTLMIRFLHLPKSPIKTDLGYQNQKHTDIYFKKSELSRYPPNLKFWADVDNTLLLWDMHSIGICERRDKGWNRFSDGSKSRKKKSQIFTRYSIESRQKVWGAVTLTAGFPYILICWEMQKSPVISERAGTDWAPWTLKRI